MQYRIQIRNCWVDDLWSARAARGWRKSYTMLLHVGRYSWLWLVGFGAGMEVDDGMYAELSHLDGRMSGHNGALPECVVVHWWHPISSPSRCTALDWVESESDSLPGKVLTRAPRKVSGSLPMQTVGYVQWWSSNAILVSRQHRQNSRGWHRCRSVTDSMSILGIHIRCLSVALPTLWQI